MALVVYVFEESRDIPTHENELFAIDAAGYIVDMSAVFVERSSCTAPSASRVAFQRAQRRLQAGDTLITTKLWGLGNSVADVVMTLAMLRQRGVAVVCLAYGKVDLCSKQGEDFVQALELADDLERLTRRSRAREAASMAKERGVTQGRPSSLSQAQQRQALLSLGAGLSVTEIARTLNTSRQTIMRLRDAHESGKNGASDKVDANADQAADASESSTPEPIAANQRR